VSVAGRSRRACAHNEHLVSERRDRPRTTVAGMTRLLEKPSLDQSAVLSAIHSDFDGNMRWPLWQYVDLSVRPRGTAATALASMPRVRATGPGVRQSYGWTWWENIGVSSVPQANTTIQLTVAGLMALEFDDLPKIYVKLLRLCCERQSQLRPSPTQVVTATIEGRELKEVLFPDTRPGIVPTQMTRLRLLVDRELPTQGQIVMQPDDWWNLRVPADITDYDDIETVDGYLNRVEQVIEPPAPMVRSAPSPFTVPDIVSFLDAVWTAKLKRPLFLNVDPGRAASLVYPAQTPDEFDSRCSALTDVLARLDVPPDDSLQRKHVRPVVLLGSWMAKRLPDGPRTRIQGATEVLSRIVDVRVGAQHTNERAKVVRAFEELGLRYPPADWSIAWTTLRQAAVNALDAIRQEVAGLTVEDL
jgi:hypothetical protein